jgi:glycosyltransferase involved in cell wall biosynthesis
MISVCIASCNGEKFIRQQIDSIICQLGKDDEIIISDDSSTDKTVQIIKNYNDPRIILIENCKFHSPVFNLENAMKQAKGDYIFLSDQDDLWGKNKIEITLEYLKHYNVVVSDCNLIDEDGNETLSSFFKLNGSKSGLVRNFIKNSYLGCCMAFDRKILKSVLPFPPNIAMHDIWIGLISELIGKPVFITEKLVSYRRHSLNFSPTSETSKFSIWYKISYRLQFFYYAAGRYFKIIFHENQYNNSNI